MKIEVAREVRRSLRLLKALAPEKRENPMRDLREAARLGITPARLTLAIMDEDLVTTIEMAAIGLVTTVQLQQLIQYTSDHNLWIDPLKAAA